MLSLLLLWPLPLFTGPSVGPDVFYRVPPCCCFDQVYMYIFMYYSLEDSNGLL